MNTSRSSILATVAVGAVAFAMATHSANAGVVDTAWTGDGDGTLFQDDDNWQGDATPAAGDDVFFDGVMPTVTFSANTTSSNLDIINGSDVTFDLDNPGNGSFTYTVTNTLLVDDSAFTVINGTLNAADLLVNNGGSMEVGAGATLNVTNSAIIGDDGVGTLDILDGGQFTALSAVIGSQAGGDGTVIVDGDDGEVEPTASTWTVLGTLIVGDEGTGVLNIGHNGMASTGNEGVVSANMLIVGNGAGSLGAVNVGEFGVLQTNSALIGGDPAGFGSANIGGLWTNTGTIQVGSVPDDEGDVAGGPTGGILNVQAAGTVTTAVLEVGDNGTVNQAAGGYLMVTNAELDLDVDLPVTSGLFVGFGEGGSGLLNLTGGSDVNIADDAVIGSAGGTGTVNVVGEDGLDAPTLDVDGDLAVGDEGTGQVNVQAGGVVTVGGDGNVGANADGGTGAITVDGENSELNVTGTLTVGFDDADLDGVAAEMADLTGMVFVTDTATLNAGAVVINETGLLGGDGSIIGNVNVFGWLSPGASIGELNIDGNLTLEPGSILSVEYDESEPIDVMALFGIDPDADLPEGFEEILESDIVAVTGTATLEDGSQVQIVKLSGGNQIGDAIIVIAADGGVLGDPANLIIEGNAFVAWTAEVINGDFLLLTAQFDEDAFDDFIGDLTGNLANVANALGDGGLLEIIGSITDPEADLTSLLPLQHGAASFQNLQTSRIFNNSFLHEMSAHRSGLGGIALNGGGGPLIASSAHNPRELSKAISALDRLEETGETIAFNALQDPGTWGGFLRGLGVWDDVDSDGPDRVGHQARVMGIHGGVHKNLSPDFLFGISLGYLNTDLDFDMNMGDGDIHTVRVGPYLSWSPGGGDFFIDGSVTYGYHRNDIERTTLMGTASADYNAHDISAFGQAGVDFLVFDRTVLTPLVGVEFTYLSTDSYRESGGAALSVDSESTESLRLRLGAKISHAIDLAGLTIVPEFYAGWAHEFLDEDMKIGASFVGAPGSAFSTRVEGTGRDAMQIAAGISALFDPNMALFIRYEGEFQSDRDIHGIVGGVNFNF